MLVESLAFCLQPGVVNATNAMAEAYVKSINANLSRARIQRDAMEKNEMLFQANKGLIALVGELDKNLVETQTKLNESKAEVMDLMNSRSRLNFEDTFNQRMSSSRLKAMVQLMAVAAEAERVAERKDELTGLDDICETHFYRVVDSVTGDVYKREMNKREYLYNSFMVREFIFKTPNGVPDADMEDHWMKLLVEFQNVHQILDVKTFLERKPKFSAQQLRRELYPYGAPFTLRNGEWATRTA